MRVLVVEDDPGMAAVLARGLRESGFAVDVTSNGQDGLWLTADIEYDIVVLDIGLPDVDGLHVLARLRAAKRWMPVLLLTARDAVDDRVIGLDTGADDYLTKPFAFPELLARIRALVRRGPRERSNLLVVGDLELDPATRQVRRAGTPVPLTSKEFALLECFMLAPGQVLTRTHLIEHVWDVAFDTDSNVVDVYVGYLRAKIDRRFGCNTLQTVRGSGYVLRDENAAR
ncbi:MAG: response regulator transcription factor [Actinomycetota bacterium]|nr:response regulator transcription factor [Actinomycetota bacterium]